MRFKTFLQEMAIPLSLYKKTMKKIRNWNPKQEYFEIFSHYDTGDRKNKLPYRIYLPINYKAPISNFRFIIKEINIIFEEAYKQKVLKDLFVVEDFIAGLAVKANDKKRGNLFKIGKLLNKIINSNCSKSLKETAQDTKKWFESKTI